MKWEQAKGGSKKRKGCLVAVVIVAIILIGSIARCGGGGSEALDWPSSGLAAMLPDPPSNKGNVISDDEESFSASVDEVSQGDYDDYVNACKEMGYTVDAEESGSDYDAFSEEGYRLSLSFYSSLEEMKVSLDAPIAMGDITWPSSGIGALLPVPPSLTGKVALDSSTRYSVYVSMDADAFSSYVDACIDAGFDVDYDRDDDYFTADDASGNSIDLSYEGFNTVHIEISAATPDDSTGETEAPETTDASSSESSSSDFRAMVDEYEDFMNEYCDFMEKYNSDSGNVVSMAADYASMMDGYSEWLEKIDAIDEDNLSTEDDQYFIDAQTRINQRLMEIGLS